MGKNGIPDRWIPYSAMGRIIPGTRFIACKVPLKDGLLRSLPEEERFGPKDLLEAFPKVGLLVDLTNTTRYYFKQEFTDKNIRYEKIFCPGKVIPPNSIIKQFFDVVDDYLTSETDPDAVIVVHCTHGVNRTGYFICRYMIERLNLSPEEAVKNFQLARGHSIERETYVSDLRNGCKGGNESDLCFVSDRGFRGDKKRGNKRPLTNFRGDFNYHASNISDETTGKRRNSYIKNSKDNNPNVKWNNPNHKYFNNSDRKRNQGEDSKFSYNWRDHGTNVSTRFPSTTPLPQFTPAHHQMNHQRNSRSPYQPPAQPFLEQPPSAVIYDYAGYPVKGYFPGPTLEGAREGSIWGFNSLSKRTHTQTSNEAAPVSTNKREIISNADNSRFSHIRNQMPNSGFRGHYCDRKSGRGGGRDRGRSQSRGNHYDPRNCRKGSERNNYSR